MESGGSLNGRAGTVAKPVVDVALGPAFWIFKLVRDYVTLGRVENAIILFVDFLAF